MSVKDLMKYGYVVELRDGSRAILMPTKNGDYFDFCDNICCLKFSNYNDNLCYNTTTCNRYDVMKIFGYSKYGYGTFCNNKCNRDLIWERKERPSVGDYVRIVNVDDFRNVSKYILLDEYIGKTGKIIYDYEIDKHSYKIKFNEKYMDAIDEKNGKLLFDKRHLELI